MSKYVHAEDVVPGSVTIIGSMASFIVSNVHMPAGSSIHNNHYREDTRIVIAVTEWEVGAEFVRPYGWSWTVLGEP